MGVSFNLVSEHWIPCVRSDGSFVELGIEEVLGRAAEIAEIRDQSPLVTAALHRLLLAVLHRAQDGPRSLAEWEKLWARGSWNMGVVGKYLAKWRDRFDLFDEKHPFFQIAGFAMVGKGADDSKSSFAIRMFQELANGNNDTLFDHTVEEVDHPLPPAVAARALVATQAFAIGGGVCGVSTTFGKHPNLTHAPLVGGVVSLLRGKNLWETLALNLLVVDDERPIPATRDDGPCWERDLPEPPRERLPRGYLDYLTWQSRAARLVPEAGSTGTVVREVHFAQGQALPGDLLRPEFSHHMNEKRGVIRIRLSENRALWRDSAALFTSRAEPGGRDLRAAAVAQAASLYSKDVLPRDRALSSTVLGLANDKAKVLLWRMESMPISERLLNDDLVAAYLVTALADAQEGHLAVWAALKGLTGSMKDGMQVVREIGERRYWADLEPRFWALLNDIGHGDAPMLRWRENVVRCARRSFSAAAENSAGRSARELAGRVAAEKTLNKKLRGAGLLETKEGDAK
ncbi:MAG: type I-E CRISPR-associated protein Cse1/CasA [Proteobacteria bacterium]|jgi:CRISPR system Cascade subunit CasA|nr:type I-E CRISPR-associated protein Cse1/CasA [Pseudomonadota bacterium]